MIGVRMKTLALGVIAVLIVLAQAEAQPMTNAPPAPAPIVFFDIAGPDAAKLKAFYAANFGWSIDGADAIKTPKLEGTLRQDPPETLIYLGVPDIDAALKAINASGGSTVMPRMVIPNVVTFALFKDPAGNRMGLVEVKAP
jgi:predicted enzyme related to lactoylglutathione lyase